jgi:hypothetical protein
MAVLQPTVVKYHMGSDVNAVYFPQLGHLAVLINRNMSIEFPAHLEWELRVSPGLMKMKKVLIVVHDWRSTVLQNS